MFDTEKLLRIKTDAWNLAINIYLIQEYKDKHHLVVYILRKLSLAELNYDIYNKELLAIVAILET